MKIRKLSPLALVLAGQAALAQDLPLKNIQMGGWGFFRHEAKSNGDYKTSTKDKLDFNQTRLNLLFKADLADDYGYIVFSPQFSKVSGQNEFNATSSNGNTETQSSGAQYDPRLDGHEAYIALRPTQDKDLHILAGRQELAYGDHLIIGSGPWHRIGRSFDGVRVRYQLNERFGADVFVTKLQENNSSTAAAAIGEQDADFHGVYIYGGLGPFFSNTDFYVLRKDNQSSGDFVDTTAYGARLKSKVGDTAFDYRAEGTFEQVRLVGDTDVKPASQYNIEAGYTLPFYTTRLALEFVNASAQYDQLFPTAHKFLGYADQFSRRNIKSYVARFSTKPSEKLTFFTDYHLFKRNRTSSPGYGFSGNSLGSVGNEKDMANELDLVLAYDFTKTVQLSGGYAWVNAGDYLKDQSEKVNAQTQWSYLQLLVKF